MKAKPKTMFAGASPFGAPARETDVGAMTIGNDPLPSGRASRESKYDDLFARIKPGQCIKCQSYEVSRVSNQFRKYVTRRGNPDLVVRSMAHYPSDSVTPGRVWLVRLKTAC